MMTEREMLALAASMRERGEAGMGDPRREGAHLLSSLVALADFEPERLVPVIGEMPPPVCNLLLGLAIAGLHTAAARERDREEAA